MDPTTREQRSRPARRGSSPDRYSLVGLTVSKTAMGGSELVAITKRSRLPWRWGGDVLYKWSHL